MLYAIMKGIDKGNGSNAQVIELEMVSDDGVLE